MSPLLTRQLAISGLQRARFESAYERAKALYSSIGVSVEDSDRIKLCALLSYREQSRICDLGSYINLYPVCLALLGMKVTTVDYYPQTKLDSPFFNASIGAALELYEEVGINVIRSNLYDVELGADSFDIISSFETFEHLWHSPKPILGKVRRALAVGGNFVFSVPNIVRLTNRVKVLIGRSPLPSYPFFYDHGTPFTGHRREMTTDEVRWMLTREGFELREVFTASLMPPLGENPSFLGRTARHVENRFRFLPSSLKSQIFATTSKQDCPTA